MSSADRQARHEVVLRDDTRAHLASLVDAFLGPRGARPRGIGPASGILLHGPPGTGKTTIARAVGSAAGARFYERSATDLLPARGAEPDSRIARLFSEARANPPAIVFVDEIDRLVRARGDSADPWEERAAAQLLRELEGLPSGAILLVAATNRPDVVDPALRRRLATVEIGLPDGTGRLRLLRRMLAGSRLDEGVDLPELAEATQGMSGADLERLCDLAGMTARERAAGSDDARATCIASGDLAAALDAMRRRESFAVV